MPSLWSLFLSEFRFFPLRPFFGSCSHVVGHPLVVLEQIRPGGGQGGAEGGGGAAAPDARRRLVQGARQTAGYLEEKKKCVLTVGKHKKRKWRKQYWLAFDDQVQMFE